MGCGCGGPPRVNRPTQTILKNPDGSVLDALANGSTAGNRPVDGISEERRKIEKLRRDAILRALGRP